MPNATVRANTQNLPEATNRRAVLGAVLASAAAGTAAALPATSAAQPPALSDVDRQVLDFHLTPRRKNACAPKKTSLAAAVTAVRRACHCVRLQGSRHRSKNGSCRHQPPTCSLIADLGTVCTGGSRKWH